MNPTEKAYHAWVESICKLPQSLCTGQTEMKKSQSKQVVLQLFDQEYFSQPH